MLLKQIVGLGVASLLIPSQANALCSSTNDQSDKAIANRSDRQLVAVSAVNNAWSGNYLSVDYAECKSRAENGVNLLLGNTKISDGQTSFIALGSSSSVSGAISCFEVEGTVAYTIDTGGCNHFCQGACDSEVIYRRLDNIMKNGI